MMTRVGPQVPHGAALSLLQPETGEPPAKRVCEAMAANRFVPDKRLQPFANQGVKDSVIDASWHAHIAKKRRARRKKRKKRRGWLSRSRAASQHMVGI